MIAIEHRTVEGGRSVRCELKTRKVLAANFVKYKNQRISAFCAKVINRALCASS
jgi:hypothetical protein